MAAGVATPGPLDLRVYVGPKSIDGLKAVRPPLNSLVQFGWWGFIAEPLFYSPDVAPSTTCRNYGWAIVLITIAINMVMFPLKVKSMRAMQKMQKVAPEVKAIQERYKKYSMRDPRKAEMNKEVMAVYSREGINPLGSCWPTLIQMPIWFGLYRMLANTIELRHAPWFGWIHDLSAHDPYFILPVGDGHLDVFHAENDAHAGHGPGAGQDDGRDAFDIRRHVCALSERPGGVYTHKQYGGNWAAVVSVSDGAASAEAVARPRQEEIEFAAT